MSKPVIGFIGLGLMGGNMVENQQGEMRHKPALQKNSLRKATL